MLGLTGPRFRSRCPVGFRACRQEALAFGAVGERGRTKSSRLSAATPSARFGRGVIRGKRPEAKKRKRQARDQHGEVQGAPSLQHTRAGQVAVPGGRRSAARHSPATGQAALRSHLDQISRRPRTATAQQWLTGQSVAEWARVTEGGTACAKMSLTASLWFQL